MNNVTYAREKKLEFPVKGLRIKGIPVLVSAQLSFYQKHMVLLLQKGIKASSSKELSETISNILNVSESCVEEFIEYLRERNYIVFDLASGTFSLSKALHVTIDPQMNNAMFADTDIKSADCDKVVYVDDVNEFFLESDFPAEVFAKKGGASLKKRSFIGEEVLSAAADNEKKICSLISKAFENTNIHLQPSISYEIRENEYSDYKLEFSALIQYRYSAESKRATREATIVPNDNFLPQSFIEQLSQKYNFDDEIPRFIELDESFYQRVSPTATSIVDCEKNKDEAENQLPSIREDIKEKKANLTAIRKERTKNKKEKQKEIETVAQKLVATNEAIETNAAIISNTQEGENEELIANLKADNLEAKKEADRLSAIIKDKETELEDSEKSFKEKEEALSGKIRAAENELAEKDAQIRRYESELKRLTNEYNQLLVTNKKKVNPIINKVIEKYSLEDNVLYRDICDISSQLDGAISASENNAFDEVRRSLANVRNRYRQTVKVVLDTLLSKDLQNLGGYFTDPFNLVDLENLFRVRKVSPDIKNKLIMFHSLVNALGHITDNGPKRIENEKRVEDFKNLSIADRENVLLSVPRFFAEINFTKAEIKKMVNKLKL